MLAHDMRITPGKSVFLFVCWWILSTILGSIIINFLGVDSLVKIRCAVLLQDIFLFILPVLLTVALVAVNPFRFLNFSGKLSTRDLLLTLAIVIVAIPAMNRLVAWNEGISLPESFSGLENLLRNSEDAAKASVQSLMGGSSVWDLIISILIMGCLTGFAEELFFRGGLQTLLVRLLRNPHVAVWSAAFIFSAVHLQFYGFVPRLFMGAFFGYLMWYGRSIWLPMAAHALNNSLVVLNNWLLQRGVTTVNADSIGVGDSAMSYVSVLVSCVLMAALMYLLFNRRARVEHNQAA